jgi:hypothetical protein
MKKFSQGLFNELTRSWSAYHIHAVRASKWNSLGAFKLYMLETVFPTSVDNITDVDIYIASANSE